MILYLDSTQKHDSFMNEDKNILVFRFDKRNRWFVVKLNKDGTDAFLCNGESAHVLKHLSHLYSETKVCRSRIWSDKGLVSNKRFLFFPRKKIPNLTK